MTTRRGCLALLTSGLSGLAGCGYFSRSGGERGTPRETRRPTTEATSRPTTVDVVTDTPPETATATASPTPAGAAVLPERSFGTVVDMVEDAGVDASGETPVDDAVEANLATDTLLVFPEGRYAFERSHTVQDLGRVGVVGRGNAEIVPPQGWNEKLFDVAGIGEFLFAGFDIDITSGGTSVGLKVVCRNAFRVEDVEFVGRGTHPDTDVYYALNARVTNPDGRGVVRNLVAKKGSAIDRYKNGGGRGGIYVGPWNEGTITIEDCHLAEFGNNGIYASRTPGNVRVIGGTFRNNNPSSVRLGGRGSRVEDAVIEVDMAKYGGPPFDRTDAKLRGVVVEQKTERPEILKPAGMAMRGCRLDFKENPTSGAPVVVWSNGKTLTIENCRINVENDAPAVLRGGLTKQGTNPPWRGRRWVRLANTRITGAGASGTAAVRLVDAPGSELRNCRIRWEGDGCTGVELARSGDTTIHGGSVRSSSYPAVIEFDDAGDGCLVSFVDGPRLEMLGGAGDDARSFRLGTVCRTTPGSVGFMDTGGIATACCVTREDLSGAVSESVPGIHITGVREDTVNFSPIRDG